MKRQEKHPKLPRPKLYVCEECGNANLEAPYWVQWNTGQLLRGDPPVERLWCDHCENDKAGFAVAIYCPLFGSWVWLWGKTLMYAPADREAPYWPHAGEGGECGTSGDSEEDYQFVQWLNHRNELRPMKGSRGKYEHALWHVRTGIGYRFPGDEKTK